MVPEHKNYRDTNILCIVTIKFYTSHGLTIIKLFTKSEITGVIKEKIRKVKIYSYFIEKYKGTFAVHFIQNGANLVRNIT